ncbi:UNVERIFIED_CONTAM: Retrovirus-related Pol polyprotein from transposon.6 [Sesamum radiatum]|uniref:Retrovirus-related Pol polyprotein from transposon.6 n=1 Tax=Sesamum radiatum TaxID=300843 RepID=A0AAW2W7Z7_SESRA
MPFGLTNAPTTFCTLMNQVLHGFLDEFVVVYLDDIIIYSRTLAEHVEHLRQVLARLREYELYAKVSKCSFAQETINFLGHIVEKGRNRMDPKKVQAIEEWQPPSDVHDLRSFLGLTNYYRRFVKGYSEIARPMNTEEDGNLELNTPMPSIFRQLEESDGDRSCVGLTRYVETIHGGD